MKATRSKRAGTAGKKRTVLSSLRSRQILRELSERPRRLTELFLLLEKEERTIRGKAALALAQLSEVQPARLIRHLDRLCSALEDDSAYVRWTAAYALGQIGSKCVLRPEPCLHVLLRALEDGNATVRAVACGALARIGRANPEIIRRYFESCKREMPPMVASSIPPEQTMPMRNRSSERSHIVARNPVIE